MLTFDKLAAAQFGALSCRLHHLPEYRQTCRVSNFCGVIEQTEPQQFKLNEDLSKRICVHQKASACFCMTVVGGRYFRSNDFEFDDVAVYGNFCGWRNRARSPHGDTLNWRDQASVRPFARELRPIDALDDLCKQHDIDYFADPVDICAADRRAIRSMRELALNSRVELSLEVREQALVMAEALNRNRWTCGVLRFLK